MMDECVLFTSCYPFNHGETFLETEIGYLSKFFKRIYIFALTSDISSVRGVPDNVVYYSLDQTNFRFKKVRKILSGLFHNIIPIKNMSFKNKMVCFYKRGTVYRALKKCLSIIDKEGFSFTDKTLFYSYWINETALTAILLRKKLQLSNRCISRAHGSDIYDYAQPWGFNPFQGFIVENLDKIYTVSDHGAFYLSNLYPDYKAKINISRLGTKDCGIELHSNLPTITFVTCSNIIPIKRVDFFANIFCSLDQVNCQLKWVCIGDGEQLTAIQKIVSENKKTDDVIFLGKTDNQFVLDYYKTHSISYFVNLSSTEGLPVSIMEAMSFGIPCIATDVGGTSEIVNQSNGFLLDKEITLSDAKAIFQKAICLNEEKYLCLRKSARKTWAELFNSEDNYTKWCKTLIKENDD